MPSLPSMAHENGNGIGNGHPADLDQSPYYISPHDRATDVILHFSLSPDGKNYMRWSESMMIALIIKDKHGFIDGTLPPPPEDSPDFVNWRRCDSMVRSWICNSIEINSSLFSIAIYAKSAKVLWDELHQLFYLGTPARIYEVMVEMSRLKQGGLTVAEYFTKLMTLWTELDYYMPGCTCECGAAEYKKVKDNEKLCQFLIGLDSDKFRIAKLQILNSESMPSLREAYAKVAMEELADTCI